MTLFGVFFYKDKERKKADHRKSDVKANLMLLGVTLFIQSLDCNLTILNFLLIMGSKEGGNFKRKKVG